MTTDKVSSFVTSKSQILLLLLLRKYHKVFLANIWVGQPMKMQEKYFQKPTEWKLTMLQVQKSGWQHRFSSCLFKCVVKLLGIGNRQLTWLQSCLKIPKIHRTVHNWFVFFFFFFFPHCYSSLIYLVKVKIQKKKITLIYQLGQLLLMMRNIGTKFTRSIFFFSYLYFSF